MSRDVLLSDGLRCRKRRTHRATSHSQWTPRWRYFFEMDTDTNGDQSLIVLATRLAQVGQETRTFAPFVAATSVVCARLFIAL